MSDFESDLKKHLSENGSYDPGMGQKIKRQSSESFNRRLRWVELATMFYVVVLLIVALFEFHLFLVATDFKMMILFAIIFLMVMEGINLMKLWYWVVNAKLNILRELKQLRVEIRDLATAVHGPTESLAAGIEESDRVLGGGLPNWVRWAYSVSLSAVVAVAMVSLFANDMRFLFPNDGIIDKAMMAVSSASFIAEQTDEWIPTFSDKVAVQSEITLKKWPEAPSNIPITLPYSNGIVISASLDGEPVSFTEKGAGRYDLGWSEPAFFTGKRDLQVVWSFPFEDLERCEKGWRTKLQSLLPTKYYRLNVVIVEGSGLEATEKSDGTRFTPFWGTGNAIIEYGSCAMMIRKRVEGGTP
jgi:hypothetical protein